MTRTVALAFTLACAMAASPVAADTIPELEPFLKEGVKIEGTPAGDGSYTDVTLGKDGETKVERFSFSIDGDRLTDLRMEAITGDPDEDGTVASADLIEVVNASIPTDLDEAEEAEIFDFFLNLDAERIAMQGFRMVENDSTVTVDRIAAENVVDGRFGSAKLTGLQVDGKTDDDLPLRVSISDVEIRGFGAGYALYMRGMMKENFPAADETGISDDDAAFLDAFKLRDHMDHLKLESMTLKGVDVAVNGLDVFALDHYDYETTQYSGTLPAGGVTSFAGVANVQNISTLPNDNPEAAMAMQAFLAAYGKPEVRFSGRSEQVWSEAEKTMRLSGLGIDVDGLFSQTVDMTMSGYDPAAILTAIEDPEDGITLASVMSGSLLTGASIKIVDKGALDIGFTLAPPGIEREQIALQAAQIAGIGVVQAMQMGITLTGSVAEVVSGFIRQGGTIEVRLADGAAIPMNKLYALMAEPENPALAQEILGMLKLEVVGAP